MRRVSPIEALVTPRSVARALSSRATISGRTNDAVDDTLPRPEIVRRSRSTERAANCSVWGSSPVRTRTYFSPELPRPTLVRTAGIISSSLRMRFSIVCFFSRSPRPTNCMVSVARRTSAASVAENGSLPTLPAPMVV